MFTVDAVTDKNVEKTLGALNNVFGAEDPFLAWKVYEIHRFTPIQTTVIHYYGLVEPCRCATFFFIALTGIFYEHFFILHQR